MKKIYEFEVKEKTALNRKKFCNKCGSHVYKVFKQINPVVYRKDIDDVDMVYNIECAECGHEGPYKYSRKEAIKAWMEDN